MSSFKPSTASSSPIKKKKKDPKVLLRQIAEVQALLNQKKKMELEIALQKKKNELIEKKRKPETALTAAKIAKIKINHFKKVQEQARVNTIKKRAILKKMKEDRIKGQKLCLFYTKFGLCKRQNEAVGCPYRHDKSKIAICLKFIKGICPLPKEQCLLTHEIIKDRMPHCHYFIQKRCGTENCPYLHVNVNPNSPICMDFANGYCPRGGSCTNKHLIFCPDFKATDTCPRGKKCPLRHIKAHNKNKNKIMIETSSINANDTDNNDKDTVFVVDFEDVDGDDDGDDEDDDDIKRIENNAIEANMLVDDGDVSNNDVTKHNNRNDKNDNNDDFISFGNSSDDDDDDDDDDKDDDVVDDNDGDDDAMDIVNNKKNKNKKNNSNNNSNNNNNNSNNSENYKNGISNVVNNNMYTSEEEFISFKTNDSEDEEDINNKDEKDKPKTMFTQQSIRPDFSGNISLKEYEESSEESSNEGEENGNSRALARRLSGRRISTLSIRPHFT